MEHYEELSLCGLYCGGCKNYKACRTDSSAYLSMRQKEDRLRLQIHRVSESGVRRNERDMTGIIKKDVIPDTAELMSLYNDVGLKPYNDSTRWGRSRIRQSADCLGWQ